MKLIIHIPCYNEASTLPATLRDLPAKIEGIDAIEVLIVDDGSVDQTVDVAQSLGVQHIIRHKRNLGLGRAFRTGLDHALKLGADIVVNTDGDGQYRGEDIGKLIQPILEGRADVVVGDRQVDSIAEFGRCKKFLQRLGSHVVKALSGIDIPDAVSGFRALSRAAAIRLNILSRFSYTVEMLIQAGNKQLSVVSIPIKTNPKTRDSRLAKSVLHFVVAQTISILRMYAMYRPMRYFLGIALMLMICGGVPIARFLVDYFSGDGSGHFQSLLLGGTLCMMGFMVFVLGLLSDLISQNRQISEIALEKIRELELRECGQIDSCSRVP